MPCTYDSLSGTIQVKQPPREDPSASARPRYAIPLPRTLAAPRPLAAAPRRAPHRHAPELALLPPCRHPRERAHEGSTKVTRTTARCRRHHRRPAARCRWAAAATPYGHPHVIVEACSLGRPNVLAQGVRRCRVRYTVVLSAVRPWGRGCSLWVRRPQVRGGGQGRCARRGRGERGLNATDKLQRSSNESDKGD